MQRTTLRALGALALFAAPAAAQTGLSGSESYTLAARAVPTVAGAASSASYSGLLGAGLVPSSERTSSAQHELVAGVLAFDGDLAPGGPVVLAVSPALGDKNGGDQVAVIGVNLVDDASATGVDFGGAPVLPLAAQETELQVVTPPGVDVWGNALGPVDVGVSHGGGAASRTDAFLYTPAITQVTPARVGQTVSIAVDAPPGGFHQLSLGPLFGFGAPIPPIDGALLIDPLYQLTPLVAMPTGHAVATIGIPDKSSLIGISVSLQDLVITSVSPLAASFTNVVSVTFEP